MSEQPGGQVAGRGSILVIEDDEDIRGLLASRLERMGYEVRAAASGEDGIEAAIEQPPHLVMLDIMLPGIDGWEVARRLRANPATAAVPLVIASILEPSVEPGEPGEPLSVEANAFLAKPFTARQVETVIDRIVGSPPARLGSPARPTTARTAPEPEGSR